MQSHRSGIRLRSWARVGALGAVLLVSAPLLAQTSPASDPEPEVVRPAAADAPPPPPVTQPAPIAHWSHAALKQLLDAIDASSDEGLRPIDYQRDAIAQMLADNRKGDDVDLAATMAARALAHDYADGRITDRTRYDWHIDHSPAALVTLDADLDHAIEEERLPDYLQGLLPQDPRYAALRTALKATPRKEIQRIAHIRASMERWRWMPRALGPDYVMVNVPAYRLALYQGEEAVQMHDVVVGAKKTPTPMISANIGSIVVNPWWTLPPTVLAEGKRYSRAKGYLTTKVGDKLVIRQKPGPDNALGRLKIDMPNPYAIYLHDTPAKAAFARLDRALSHGCIRVKDIQSLAGLIDDPTNVEGALGTPDTQTLQLEKSLPVYIVYFTAGAAADGRVVTYADPYGRDPQLIAAMDSAASGTTTAAP